MRINSNLGKASLLALALVLMSATLSFAKSNEYQFKVHNNTKQAIKKMFVSVDGKKWGEFDIGTGSKAGATETLVWDKSTDNEPCEQYFKVVFADGDESEAVKFDFCESSQLIPTPIPQSDTPAGDAPRFQFHQLIGQPGVRHGRAEGASY